MIDSCQICLSNLKELGNCFWQYTSDYNGYFGTSGSGKYEKWFNYLRPYYSPGENRWGQVSEGGTGLPVKKVKLLLCPSASSKFWSDESNGKTLVTQSAFIAWGIFPLNSMGWEVSGAGGSYGANSWAASIPSYTPVDRDKYWQNINVDGGENIPLLADCATVGGKPKLELDYSISPPEYDGHWYNGSLPTYNVTISIARFVLNRHTEGSNYLFMDLSARKVGLKENWTLKWSRTFNTSNRWTKAGGVEPDDWPVWMRDFKDY